MAKFKRLLAFLLSFAVLVSGLVITGSVSATGDGAEEIVYWDGETYTAPVDSDSDGIYEITLPAQLAFFVKNNGQVGDKTVSVKLMKDIWLNDMLVTVTDGVPTATKASDKNVIIDLTKPEENGLNNWFSDGYPKSSCGGTLDGNGHIVHGLYIYNTEALSPLDCGLGLIPRAKNTTVLNLGIENAYMNTNMSYGAGFIVGCVQNGMATVTRCYVGESAYHTGVVAGAIIGGGGYASPVTSCYNLATLVSSKSGYGTIVGDSWGKERIYNCYTAHGYKICRGTGAYVVENSYSISEAPGKAAATSMANLGGDYVLTDGYPVLKVFGKDTEIWGGFKSTPVDADEDGVYEINTPEELAYIASGNGAGNSYVLTKDIYLNDTEAVDWTTGEVNEGYSPNEWYENKTFKGTFDGNGHTVYGLYYPVLNNRNEDGTSAIDFNSPVGLFPLIDVNTTIKNVAVSKSYLETVGFAGAIVGFFSYQTEANILIDNCYSDETVTINSYKPSASGNYQFGSGGILGGFYSSGKFTVSNCYSLAKVGGAQAPRCNLIIGDIWEPKGDAVMKNCYAYGGKPCPGAKNATVNSFINVYSTSAKVATHGEWTPISAANMTGTKASTNMPGLGDAFVVTSGTPALKKFVEYNELFWSGFPASGANSGEGTSADPYMITNGEELAWAIQNSKADKYYKLANNIYLNDITRVNWTDGVAMDGYTPRSWYKQTSVQGNFDGDNHVVYGLYYKSNNGVPGTSWGFSDGAGLFPTIADSTTLNISNMGIDSAYVNSQNGAGAFVGAKASNSATDANLTVNNSYVGEEVTLIGQDTGAAIGINRGVITTVNDFYTLATQTAASCTGIASDWYGGSINLNRVYNAKGSLDSKNVSTVTNGYATTGKAGTIVTAAAMQGETAKVTMYGLGDKFVATETYPALKSFVENNENTLGAAPFVGEGTEEDPYLISDTADLRNMVGLGGQGKYYKLTNDIYVNDVNAVDWKTGTVNAGYDPVEWFSGSTESGKGYEGYESNAQNFSATIDGNGYAIHGIYYAYANAYTDVGFIPFANKVTITNLGMEDCYIGGGRFTGGMIGYTVGSAKVNLSGCYIDDSCTVHGWDAGAAYVDSDSDISETNSGSALCSGSATDSYYESATGKYVYEGGTYHTFTAADYNGTKYAQVTDTTYTPDEAGTYKYDEENDAYVEIGAEENYEGTRYVATQTTKFVESTEGTYLLDGEEYRLITIDDYTGKRYDHKKLWSSVGFTSEAVGSLVGRFESNTVANIDNCYATASLSGAAVKAFGFSSQGVTFKEEGVCGSGNGHIGAFWGDGWNATVNVSHSFSVLIPHENNNENKTTYTDVYTLANKSKAGVTVVTIAVGENALDQMPGLDRNVWYAVKDSTDYPQLRLRGTVIGDVDENGVGEEFADTVALRKTLVGAENALNTDFNRDGTVNICDLVALSVRADAKATADAEAEETLLSIVFLSASGSDTNDGTESAPVATLAKALKLAKNGAEVVVDGTVAVDNIPDTNKTVTVKEGTLDFSGGSAVSLGSGINFAEDSSVKFADDSTVMANGNTFIINDGVTVDGIPAAIYGGGNTVVKETNLVLKAGNYKAIYGGGNTGAVLGDTNLTLAGTVNDKLPLTAKNSSYVYGGGNTGKIFGNTNLTVNGSVNAALDHTSHTAIARLYGGSQKGDVAGSTFVTIAENAEFNYIYGGCTSGTVGGATNIDFSGNAMSIYGGSGTVTETNVTVNGGWVHQVFGGLEGGTMTGNTNVTIKGGYIDRRIVGGCYNACDVGVFKVTWNSERYVTGTCTVTLYDEATYNLSGDDHGITALSRHSTNHEKENGVLVFENQTLYNNLKNDLGINLIFDSVPKYDSYTIAQ